MVVRADCYSPGNASRKDAKKREDDFFFAAGIDDAFREFKIGKWHDFFL